MIPQSTGRAEDFEFGSEPSWLLERFDERPVIKQNFTVPQDVLTPEQMTQLHELVHPFWKQRWDHEYQQAPKPERMATFISEYNAWNNNEDEGRQVEPDYRAVHADDASDEGLWFLFWTVGGFNGYSDRMVGTTATEAGLIRWVSSYRTT